MATLNVKKLRPENTIALEDSIVQEETIYLDDRSAKIAEFAYLKAEQRGFEPGHEVDDWYEAEREVDLIQTGKS